MYMKCRLLAGALMLATGVLRASSMNPPTAPQTVPLTAQEKKNVDFVLNWWRQVIYAGHLELASKYQAEDYIQHNPSDAKPIKDEWIDPPVLTLVNGPYRLMMAERTAKDPDDPTREYKWNHFNVLRVEKGLIKEHGDDFIIN